MVVPVHSGAQLKINNTMLSRASRNAYSWWWASHIRTKQSKWLDQNIQDMEEKVEYILKIITEDGDSFRVRAEQYYRKRPELVNFVEDTFRGYRALAERYDHLSKDLQSANRTIAMIFPERVQMSIDDEEYEDFTSNSDEYENIVTTNSHVPAPLPLPPKQNHLPKMESVVQGMLKKKSKTPTMMMSKKGLVKIGVDENASRVSKSSGLSKDKAVDEIEKLQKEILGFQTEKEFVRSSYESALSKYWEIENQINEMHTKISNLQHEFAVGEAIDDQDAQVLMSSSALKMCKDNLDKLKCKQKRYKAEAVVEHQRVDDIRKKFEALIAQNNNNEDLKNLEQTSEHVKDKKTKIEEKKLKSFEENSALVHQEHANDLNVGKSEGNDEEQFNKKESKNIKDKEEKTKEDILGTVEVITISEVADKTEQLVDKVITLETDLSSQTALVMRLRFEINELHEKVQSLEQENNNLVDESINMSIKIKKLEEELQRVQMLDKQIKVQNAKLETSFDEASISLDNLSKDILIAKPDEQNQEDEGMEIEKTQKVPKLVEEKQTNISHILEDKHVAPTETFDSKNLRIEEKENQGKESGELEGFVKKPNEKLDEVDEGEHLAFTESLVIRKDQDIYCNSEEDETKWNLLFSHGIEDREKMLLEEYTSTLKNFKEVKQKLNETEKRNRARSFKSAVEMKILRKANDSKDAEIRSLYEKIKLLETNIQNHELDETINIELTTSDMVDEPRDINLTKTSNATDEGTYRIEELVETTHFEVHKARDLVDGGSQRSKEPGETLDFELTKALNYFDDFTDHELQETPDTTKQRSITYGSDKGHEILEIEGEIRREIEGLRKENLELWLRFSTSYHQINRFQDSFHDLVQEITQMKEKKHEHGSSYKHLLHHHHHSSISFDIRPLYRHMRDMQTEVVLWLEKSELLEDDLQHRLVSLSDIQNELSDLTSDVSESETTNAPLNKYQAAKFQGEVLNMKQENVKVLNELREASDRVRMLQFNIEKTLSRLDEEVGQKNKSNTSSRVPFKSILFGSKLRKMHKHSLFTRRSSSLQRKYSNHQELPKPREDS
ncbi:putative protein Networked (NET), actin-binding (NAB) [Helianthus annuus]|uniref:NAB domain-containing protein n=2 Tax=Helianthus annuus TaxID=4232 RepID=A0A251UYK9_HELAN|nr:putative protein Networked (NET), actin-binding (NAB) [Helianthus annuus]KAJ0588249.1 putative protein Networked (NET), actin-binding (NAB) [Helianthus annuus]KAJ0760961.1 putative protein Networked (NET), actin-binding (NAB) [Helianthus annuus]KAJ0926332.1 putative protein Networked (NET), actin-binding (NAB) [Helianthus annuus]KAJ0930811.1 putative protein Networked (NET), actin-binding (NAB) [Helianthus annuus]